MKTIIIALTIIASLAVGQYSVTTTRIPDKQNSKNGSRFIVDVLDQSGNKIHSIRKQLPFDLPYPTVSIHPETGFLVLCYVVDGIAEVYNPTGVLMWTMDFFKELPPQYERTITTAVGKNVIAFLTSDVTLPQATVTLYSLNGNELLRRQLSYPMGYEVSLSPDEKTLIASSYTTQNQQAVFDTEIINTISSHSFHLNHLFRRVSYGQQSNFAAVCDARIVSFVNIPESRIISTATLPSEQSRIFTDALSIDGTVILQSAVAQFSSEGHPYFRSPQFDFYFSGKHVNSVAFDTLHYQESHIVHKSNILEVVIDGSPIYIPLK